MAKSNSLQSDLDFIREYEELKIKQKLLIETLNKKKNALKNELLVEIASKIDFLVKIFQEASAHDESQNNKAASASVEDVKTILDKLTALEKFNEEKFNALDERISTLAAEMPKSSPLAIDAKKELQKLENPSVGGSKDSSIDSNQKQESDSFDLVKPVNSGANKENSSVASEKLPPKPDFNYVGESNTKSGDDDKSSQKNKRKWF